MKCIKCGCSQQTRTLHRTTDRGNPNPEWMCEPCIIKYHDKSLIDEGVKEITDIIEGSREYKTAFVIGTNDNTNTNLPKKPVFYCKRVCGDGSFSIKKWNEDYKMCNDMGIEGLERDKILHPEMFPCEKQCEACMDIVIDQQTKTRNLIIFNELRKNNKH